MKEESYGPHPTVFDHLVDPAANGHVRRLFIVRSNGPWQHVADALSGDLLPGWSRPCRGAPCAFFSVLYLPGSDHILCQSEGGGLHRASHRDTGAIWRFLPTHAYG